MPKLKRGKKAQKQLSMLDDLEFITKSEEHYSDRRRLWLGNRVVVWFSCGATSAVAAKLALLKYREEKEVHVCYCDTGAEHSSNAEFLRRVEGWLDHPVEVLKNPKYASVWDVFEKKKYLKNSQGAVCTLEMKAKVRQRYQDEERDVQVLGFSLEEEKRAERFRQNNSNVYLETPLIDKGLDKGDCLAILQEVGIPLPFLYREQKSGSPYPFNNCLCCVKGGKWYFNKVRIDFPEEFDRMVELEQKLGRSCLMEKGRFLFLKDLDPKAGRPSRDPNMECSIMCQMALAEMDED